MADTSIGLTDSQAAALLSTYGKNEIPEKKPNKLLKFLSYFGGAISFLLELATVVSAILGDWIDFGILVFVLVINALIGYMQEAKAESALDALKQTLSIKSKVFRNGALVEIDSSYLVPGDIIVLRIGDIVPADASLLGINSNGAQTNEPLHIDQSALSGESLPVQKNKNDTVYSSSIVKQGQQLAVVTKTGTNTFIGRAANLIAITVDQGHFQKIINQIGNFLIIITVVLVIVILLVDLFAKEFHDNNGNVMTKFGDKFKMSLKQVLILTIAAIPVGLPTVMSVTMAVGASQLAKKQVIVKRLTAIEELASVSILCSDKTGTLTLNKLSLDNPYLSTRSSSHDSTDNPSDTYSEEDLLLYAYLASEPGAHDPIELAIRSASESKVPVLRTVQSQPNSIPGYTVNAFIPFNPSTKYTEATVTNIKSGDTFRCIKGAPQVIIHLCNHNDTNASKAVIDLATRGLRALGVARTVDAEMKQFEMVGLISLLDPPRPDSKRTIQECHGLGIHVKMITGDQLIIAKEVAQRLGMPRTILDAHKLVDDNMSEDALIDRCVKADGFAQVIPEHKFRVVELLQKRGYLVAMTGDGVNDAPALKKANVGIAVQGCTDAARFAADIVLLAPGLSIIVDGIKTSRTIFQRMRSYALYRIASTIHFLIFFFISIIVFDFSLPDRLIILIAVLNDAATLVISVDNAKISQHPDKWRIGQLITLSFILGTLLMGISFAHFFVARDLVPNGPNHDGIVQTIMYLQISSCPHFIIFSTRVTLWFWESIPSPLFMLAVVGTQIFAMFMSIYGVWVFQATAIGWWWGLAVISVSGLMFMMLDVIKVIVIRYWSFELTAMVWPTPSRRRKLEMRREETRRRVRMYGNIKKLQNVVMMMRVVMKWLQLVHEAPSHLLHDAKHTDDLVIVVHDPSQKESTQIGSQLTLESI